MKPEFTHDCERCTHMLTIRDKDGEMNDLYCCDQGGIEMTLIARYSNVGREYVSAPPRYITNRSAHALQIAKVIYEARHKA